MSISPAKRASIRLGPALKTLVFSLAGAIARSDSPDETPSTAWAWLRVAKYPIRTSAGGAEVCWRPRRPRKDKTPADNSNRITNGFSMSGLKHRGAAIASIPIELVDNSPKAWPRYNPGHENLDPAVPARRSGIRRG